ncbi:TPA: hypothetical protein EYP84_02175 [Candidatus Bipolaricaulota bacterium]|nr:hypothetical protein [Candidatus Bipolaricaulota bacterium]HIQ01740.1 hypothetical protein [Anaerolineales bacterium]
MDYGYILRRAWQILWQHKILWLFGFLASLGGRFRFDLRMEDLPPEARRRIAEFVSSPRFVPVTVGFVLLMLLIGLALAILNALGRAALVDQINRVEDGGLPTVRAGWEVGRRHVWRVFFIRLLLGLPVLVVILAGLIPLLFSILLPMAPAREEFSPATIAAAAICLLPAICLSLLLAIPTAVLQRLAARACVLEGESVWRSITRGGEVLRSELGEVAVLWLVLAAVTLGIAAVVGIPMCLLAAGMFAPLFFLLRSAPTVGLVGLCGAALLFWVLGTAIGGVIETFFSACWTLAYRDLTGLGRTGAEDSITDDTTNG